MLNVIAVFNVIRVDPTTGHAVWTGLTGTRSALERGTRSALERDGFTIDPNSMSHCQRDWFDEHGYLDAESRARIHARGESENEAETLNAIAIRPNTRHAVVDRARRNSDLEPRAVSRKSVLSMRSTRLGRF
jgi:hypothetical protein